MERTKVISETVSESAISFTFTLFSGKCPKPRDEINAYKDNVSNMVHIAFDFKMHSIMR